MRLVLASDHAGYDLRKHLGSVALSLGYEVFERGAPNGAPYDYPNAADEAIHELLGGNADVAILICGTGIGVSIRANRHRGVRAALCCNPRSAELARQHNHANALCLGARLLTFAEAEEIMRVFLKTAPDEDERHRRRVRMLDDQSNIA